MNGYIDQEQITSAATALRTRLERLKDVVESLPEAAKHDAKPKVDRMETMLSALERDITEMPEATGADQLTTRELANQVEFELNNLEHEIEALSLGNPTTVDAALDASLHAVEKAGNALRKLTEKVKLKSH